MARNILVVEDDRNISDLIRMYLEKEGFDVRIAYDGGKAVEEYDKQAPDMVLLDIMLPVVDGWGVCAHIREKGKTPIIMLTAKSDVGDRITGLEMGADDYLVKPFHLEELEARVRSLTRRSFVQHDAVLRCGELSFDTVKRTAQVRGEVVALTRKENGILEYLLLNQGRPVSQEELMEHVWDGSVNSFSNSIRVHISSLRKKLKAALGYDPILNRIGEGYLMGGREP